MARFLHRMYSSACRKSCLLFLACAWILGLGFGVLLFRYDSSIASMMEMAVTCHFSIVSLLGSLFLPFLFSVFSVFISHPWLMYLVCLVKAVTFGYISCGLFSAFPGSGWLVRQLFLFADQMGVLLLFVYWQRHISGFRGFSWMVSCAYMIGLCLTAGVYICFVAPFLRRILIL